MHQGRRMSAGLAARLGLGLVAAMALRARASEYTVDNLAGADANPGTAEVPFKTLAKGLSALRGGDTLHLVHHRRRADPPPPRDTNSMNGGALMQPMNRFFDRRRVRPLPLDPAACLRGPEAAVLDRMTPSR